MTFEEAIEKFRAMEHVEDVMQLVGKDPQQERKIFTDAMELADNRFVDGRTLQNRLIATVAGEGVE